MNDPYFLKNDSELKDDTNYACLKEYLIESFIYFMQNP